MSALSDEFHKMMDAVKTEADAILGRVERGSAAALTQLQAGAAMLVQQAGPLLQQVAGTAVAAALAAAPLGSPAAILAAAETAAIAALKQIGKPVLDADLHRLKAVLLAHFAVQAPAAQNAPINTGQANTVAAPSA